MNESITTINPRIELKLYRVIKGEVESYVIASSYVDACIMAIEQGEVTE